MNFFIENISEYLRIINEFRSYSISAKDFDKMYSKQWDRDRDKEDEKTTNWPRRYDIELQENFHTGKITEEEYDKQWHNLFEYTEIQSPVLSLLDRIYTTCNCFWPDINDSEVDPPLVLNEKLFRQEIQDLFEELKTTIQKMYDNNA
jgi:hypothetical protein